MAKKMFKNTTLKQKFTLYFKENGLKEVESSTRKYKVFKGNRFYFIGRSGAVRVNDRNTVKGSHSHTDNFKKIIKKWAKKQDQEERVEI